MKIILRSVAVVLLVCLPVVLLKVAQKICWDNHVSFVAPASLDSWDPTERIEAARNAAKKYGGKR